MTPEQLSQIEEIVEWARAGKILTHQVDVLEIQDFQHERSFNRAKKISVRTPVGADAYSWADIRSYEASQFQNTGENLSQRGRFRHELEQVFKAIGTCLADSLPAPYRAALNDIDSDLALICQSRLLFQAKNTFFENLWKAYKASTWPCGWSGDYPEGRLIVFVPDVPKQNYLTTTVLNSTREEAEAAYLRQDYKQATTLYAAIETHLSLLESKRLKYARKKSLEY